MYSLSLPLARSGESSRYASITAAVVLFCALFGGTSRSWAGSATWALDANSTGWQYADDWTPQVVPDGPNDVATFSVSNNLLCNVGGDFEVNSIVFDSDADAFQVQVLGLSSLTLSGAGVVNNSGQRQLFYLLVATGFPGGVIRFQNGASAGALVDYVVLNGAGGGDGCFVTFAGSSSAGSARFFNDGVTNGTYDRGSSGGMTIFGDNSSAETAIFTQQGGATHGGAGVVRFAADATAAQGTFTNNALPAEGGSVQFYDTATAADGTFTNNGTYKTGGASGATEFFDNSTAGNATLIAQSDSATGGLIELANSSYGGTSHVQLFGYGSLEIAGHETPGITSAP